MQMFEQTAYFFVYHGSRDPRPAASAQRLSRQVVHALLAQDSEMPGSGTPDLVDGGDGVSHSDRLPFNVGALELAPTPLHAQIERFSYQVTHQGITNIRIIPLFLFPGAHVMEDIPNEVALAQQRLGHLMHLMCCPYIGSHVGLADYLQRQFPIHTSLSSTPTSIFVSHGSKRPRANQPVEAIAAHLGAKMAYWSMPPNLTDCLDDLIDKGCNDIVVMPYFLFCGKISDTIAQTVQDYRHRFPQIRIHLGHPLGECEAIAPLIAELAMAPSVKPDTVLV